MNFEFQYFKIISLRFYINYFATKYIISISMIIITLCILYFQVQCKDELSHICLMIYFIEIL